MTTTALTSELEAVNIILESCDEAPVTSLGLSGLYPLDKAIRALSESSRVIQSEGWDFNTEESYVVALAGDKSATLPANTITWNADRTITDMTLIQRGLRLYDKNTHSYALLYAPTGTIVWLLAWDDLPEPARRYILMRAASTMQGRSSVSESTYRITEEDVQEAKQALSQHESATGDYNMLRDSWSCASVLMNH
jgi:hypothetical protein